MYTNLEYPRVIQLRKHQDQSLPISPSSQAAEAPKGSPSFKESLGVTEMAESSKHFTSCMTWIAALNARGENTDIHTYQAEKYRLTFVGTPHRAEMLHWQRAPQPLVGKNSHLDRWEVGLSSYAAWPRKALQPIISPRPGRPFPSTQQLSTAFTWPSSTSGTSSFTLRQWNLTRLKPYTTRPKNGGLNPKMGNLCAKRWSLSPLSFGDVVFLHFFGFFVTSHYVDVNMKCSNASVTPW